MRWKWALAASLGLAIAASGEARAEETGDQTIWELAAPQPEGRSGEYRTTELDNWIRLTPYVGGVFWDGGSQLEPAYRLHRSGRGRRDDHDWGAQIGIALEFEPSDVLIASIDIGSNMFLFDVENPGSERQFNEGRNGTDGDVYLEGKQIHPALYLGLKNPELEAGPLRAMFGLGVGAFYFWGYEGTLPVAGAPPERVEFANSMIWHGTIFLRLDFDISKNFKLGFNLRNHILLYATDEFYGNMEPDKFGLDNMHYAFEPLFYISIAF